MFQSAQSTASAEIFVDPLGDLLVLVYCGGRLRLSILTISRLLRLRVVARYIVSQRAGVLPSPLSRLLAGVGVGLAIAAQVKRHQEDFELGRTC